MYLSLKMFLTLFFAVLLGIIFLYRVYTKKYQDIDKLPGPSTFQLVRDLYKASLSEGVVSYFLSLNEKYGPVVKVWMKPLPPIVHTTDLEYVNKIFKNQKNFYSPSIKQLTFLQNGIALNPNYESYKHDKDIINKAMNKEHIADVLKIYGKKFDSFIEEIRKKEIIDAQRELHRIFLDVMIDSFHHPYINLDKEEIEKYRNARTNYYDCLLKKMNSFFITIFYKFTDNSKLSNKCHDVIVNFTKNWLKEFKVIDEGLRNNKNLIFAMLNSGMPEFRVVANVNTLIQGGQDTMAIPLAMAFRHISRQPEIQKRIQDEIDSVFGDDISDITLTKLGELTYLNAVIKETIRMYLPLPFLDRKLTFDAQIGDTKVPKGTTVMFHLAGILKSSKYFKDPLVFNPDRFLNPTAECQQAFVAFGFGLKTCPGKNVAYAAMKLLMVKIMKEFEVHNCDEKHEPKFVVELFIRSTNGIPVAFKERRSNKDN